MRALLNQIKASKRFSFGVWVVPQPHAKQGFIIRLATLSREFVTISTGSAHCSLTAELAGFATLASLSELIVVQHIVLLVANKGKWPLV